MKHRIVAILISGAMFACSPLLSSSAPTDSDGGVEDAEILVESRATEVVSSTSNNPVENPPHMRVRGREPSDPPLGWAPRNNDEQVGATSAALTGPNVLVDANNPASNAVVRYTWTNGFTCTGTLIAPNLVLTAGHCKGDTVMTPIVGHQWQIGKWYPVDSARENTTVTVRIGATVTGSSPTYRARFVSFPGWEDMMILRLETSVPASQAIPIPPLLSNPSIVLNQSYTDPNGCGSHQVSSFLMSQVYQVVGYAGSSQRRIATVAGATFPNCTRFGTWQPNMIGALNSMGTVYEDGDSGSPLLWTDTTGQRWVLGVLQGGGDFASTFGTGGTDSRGDAHPNIPNFLTATMATTSDVFHPVSLGDKWHEWFCLGNEYCDTGDFDGDGFSDIVAFTKTGGDVYVALSSGQDSCGSIVMDSDPPECTLGDGFWNFSAPGGGLWNGWFCANNEVCRVGDVNGDGRDDVVAFVHNATSGSDVYVGRATGPTFDSGLAHTNFCNSSNTCLLGDISGDGRADAVSLGSGNNTATFGTVASGFTGLSTVSSGICALSTDECHLADVDGDGRMDLVEVDRASSLPYVRVSVAQGSGTSTTFAPQSLASLGACRHQCDFADVDADGDEDLVDFYQPTGEVWVYTSNGTSFTNKRLWHDYFCWPGEVCRAADFTSDGRADIATFVRSSRPTREGDVYVAWSAR